MSTRAELSRVDLVRQALVAAQEAAKNDGSRKEKSQRRTRVVRRDGHTPLGLDEVITAIDGDFQAH